MATATQWSTLKHSSATIKEAMCGTVKVEVSILLDFVKLTDQVGKKALLELSLKEVKVTEDGINEVIFAEYHPTEDVDRQSFCKLAEYRLKSVCIQNDGNNSFMPLFSIIDAEILNGK